MAMIMDTLLGVDHVFAPPTGGKRGLRGPSMIGIPSEPGNAQNLVQTLPIHVPGMLKGETEACHISKKIWRCRAAKLQSSLVILVSAISLPDTK